MIKNYLSLVVMVLLLPLSFVFAQTNLNASEYGSVVQSYLDNRKSDFDFKEADLQDLVVNDEFFSENTVVTHIYVNQTFQGIRIFNAISSIAIKDGKVFYYANRLLNDISDRVNTTTPSYAPISALQEAATRLNIGSIQNIQQLERNGHNYTFSNGNISSQDIKVELVFVNQNEDLVLAWDFTIYQNDNEHWWNVRVDATSNEIIEYNDLILSCTFNNHHNHSEHSNHIDFNNIMAQPQSFLVDGSSYNVYALPVESPNHGPRQIVSEPANNNASPFGWHDDDGVAGADYTITRGNNVWAKEDSDGSNSRFGFAPDGTGTLNFDFPINFNNSPLDYRNAAITNLFYLNNMMHDIWYQHGFDEASGNFQNTNYTGSGFGNDFVFADAQDGSGFNNANFGTPQDGFSPRMQMFLWSPPGENPSSRVIINNGTLAGTYDAASAAFGELLSITPITSNLVLATDGGTDTNDACETITNGFALSGNIAVLRRGTCEFGVKVLAVENAGAIAAIVVNNEPGATITMGAGAVGGSVTIPSVMLSQSDGEALINALANGQSINASLIGPDLTDYADGDFDNGIIAHEYGHGISNRLTGGPFTAGCLFNSEQMGEGWSDWFGLMITMRSTDLPENARGIGTFPTGQPTTGGGIRPRRYSPDFAVNEFTYAGTNNTGLTVPHGVGFVWATVLWDLTWAYIDKYGFDSDLYNGNGGNNRIMKLVIDGLKLQPCQPGFVDGRDALLAADLATTGGADQCMIWEVFANRGLGFNASQGLSTSRSDQIEDFSMPPNNDPSLANCSNLSVEEFLSDTLKVYPNPVQNELTISTSRDLGNVTITLIDINGRVVLSSKNSLFDTVTLSTNQIQSGLYILNIKNGNFNYNEKIIKN